jgi:hypothetical protein
LIFDTGRGTTVLFGGHDGSESDETWDWNGTNWTQRSLTMSPPARYFHSMAFDSTRHRAVLVGGYSGGAFLGDGIWELSPDTDGIAVNEHRVFVTSVTHNGDFDGTQGADDVCESLAQSVGLRQVYKAIVSDETTAANVRIGLSGGTIKSFDSAGNPFVVKANGNLWDGQPLQHAIDMDEHGITHTGNVWTGSSQSGASVNGNTCQSWTYAIPAPVRLGRYGIIGLSNWLNSGSVLSCTSTFRLYCISQGLPTTIDCDNDAVPDECELSENDCNGNSVPDNCEADSDNDGVIDGCDACPATGCGAVNATGRPRSDLNGDCAVDGRDIPFLVNCILSGGGLCSGIDPDGDGVTANMDASDDIAAFAAVATGCP